MFKTFSIMLIQMYCVFISFRYFGFFFGYDMFMWAILSLIPAPIFAYAAYRRLISIIKDTKR